MSERTPMRNPERPRISYWRAEYQRLMAENARLREERDALKLLLDNRTYELVAPLIAAKEEVWLSQQADYEGRITKVEVENARLREERDRFEEEAAQLRSELTAAREERS